MKEMLISDELYVKLRDLAARITIIVGKETTIAETVRLVTVPLKAVSDPEMRPENFQKYRRITEENKELAQENLEMLLSGLICDYNDFLDSKQNLQDPNQTNI